MEFKEIIILIVLVLGVIILTAIMFKTFIDLGRESAEPRTRGPEIKKIIFAVILSISVDIITIFYFINVF